MKVQVDLEDPLLEPLLVEDDSEPSLTLPGEEAPPGLLAMVRRYPKSVFFMLGNEFCERFSFYGMRAVLTLYFVTVHRFHDSTAKLLYHSFVSICYITPLLGSVLADGFLGRFRVILYGSMVYCLGQVVLTAGAVPGMGLPELDFAGLLVVAFATGGIKPCVSAFAADQFSSDMLRERESFFSFFYFAINCGALTSKAITPILRGRVSCFGQNHCFPLAFGVPAILMLIALILFLVGRRHYTKVTHSVSSEDNVICTIFRLVCHAAWRRCCSRNSGPPKDHWLEYGEDRFDGKLIDDVRRVLDILIVFAPVVLFCALFDQIGSTWVLQANKMNGNLGPITVLPDQMPVFNPLFVMILIPILSAYVYPLFYRLKFLDAPLKRIGAGGCLAAIAFFMAGSLQMYIDRTMVHYPEPGNSRVFLSNYLPCPLKAVSNVGNFTLTTIVPEGNDTQIDVGTLPDILTTGCPRYRLVVHNRTDAKQQATPDLAFFITALPKTDKEGILIIQPFTYQKTKNGASKFIFASVQNLSDAYRNASIFFEQDEKTHLSLNLGSEVTEATFQPELLGSKSYKIVHAVSSDHEAFKQVISWDFPIDMGPVHAISLVSSERAVLLTLVPPNSVSLLLQIPQYIVITVGEILASVTGLEFSYSQAPTGMKSVVQAFWLLTVALGNGLAILISGSNIFRQPHVEFFVYASLMTASSLVFSICSRNYNYTAQYDAIALKEK